MAEDLKTILTKVMNSKGEKKYFFAYAAGKRKDGKGDGELAIGAKKMKKAEIEGKLAACKEVLEGTCWLGKGKDDKGTVYFKGMGKSLSGMVVSKMALTAKLLTSRQYDFQVPPPEEDERATKLAEGGDEESTSAEPPDLKARLAALKKRTDEVFAKTPEARKSKLLPTYQLAEHLVSTGKEKAAESLDRLEKALDSIRPDGTLPEDGAPTGPEAAYQSRVKALQADLDKAIATGSEAGKEAKLRMSEAKLFGDRKKDYPQAMALLAVVEEQIKLALAPQAPVVSDEEKRFRTEHDRLKPDIERGVNFRKLNNELSALKVEFIQANKKVTAAEKAKDWKTGLALLPDLEKKLAKLFAVAGEPAIGKGPPPPPKPPPRRPSGSSKPATPAEEYKEKLAEWGPAIKEAMKASGPNAAAVSKLLAQATALSKPGGDIKQALEKLTECHKLATASVEFQDKLIESTAELKDAMRAGGPNAAGIAKLLRQATALSKPGGDMEQALEKLAECFKLAEGSVEYKEKLAEWTPAIKEALRGGGRNTAAIARRLRQAIALAKPGGDIDQAIEKLTECHALSLATTEA